MCTNKIETRKLKDKVLYRYDIIKPPKRWNDQHKNFPMPENDLRIKNSINAYFFYDNVIGASNIGCIEAHRRKSKVYYLTETKILKEVTLLDMSNIERIDWILMDLDDLGIDVLTNSFHNIGKDEKQSFLSLREVINSLKNKKGADFAYFELERKINDFFSDSKNLDLLSLYRFGQLLSDFENGKAFKDILTSKGYDGYMFCEAHSSFNSPNLADSPEFAKILDSIKSPKSSNPPIFINSHKFAGAPKLSTICLFDKCVLSPPTHKKISL